MEPMTSPNDPIFFLHHCFIDKVWADWQTQQKQDYPDAPQYAPEVDGPPGHNIGDQLKPWETQRSRRSGYRGPGLRV
jgi:tyrosinase